MQAMKRKSYCYLFLFVSMLAQQALAQQASAQQPIMQNGSATAGFTSGNSIGAKKEQIHWAPDLATALKAAQQFNVPVMVHLYGDDCLRCRIIEERVLSKPDLIQTLNRFFICVKINGNKNPQVMQQFGAHSYPTEVFLAPDGSTLYQDNPPDNLSGYEQRLTSVAFANRDRNAMLAAQNPAVNGSTDLSSETQDASSVTLGQAVGSQVNQANDKLAPSGFKVEATANTGPSALSAGAPAAEESSVQSQAEGRTSGLGQSRPRHVPGSQHQLAAAVGPMRGQAATSSWNQAPEASHSVQQAKIEKIAANTVVHPSVSSSTSIIPNVATTPQPDLLAGTGARFGSTTAAAGPQTIANPYAGPSSSGDSKPRVGVPAIKVSSARTVLNPHSAKAEAGTGGVGEGSAAAPQAPVFLDGYCPVSLSQEGKWVEGNTEYRVKHRGRIYCLSSQQAMTAFLANPDANSPVLSGYDPLILLEEGRLVEGSTQHALHMKETGRCLLFSSAETKRRYWNTEADFQRYSSALAALIEKTKRMK